MRHFGHVAHASKPDGWESVLLSEDSAKDEHFAQALLRRIAISVVT
jgi:hypothetical protein